MFLRSIIGCFFVLSLVSSIPLEENRGLYKQYEDYLQKNEERLQPYNNDWESSRTWTAVKNFFQPMVSWFQKDLPNKTPKDIVNDVSDVGNEVKNWVDNSYVIQKTKDAAQPVVQWLRDTHNTLKNKTFRDMFSDAADSAKRIDDQVGGWIEG